MARLVIDRLTRVFPASRTPEVRAVDGLTLTVADRELLAVVGPSGCGKTTLLRLIAGLEAPDSGGIFMDDRPLAGVPPEDRDVAMVFQNHALYPHLTVYENLALGLKLRHCPKSRIDARVGEAAGLLGLGARLDRKPDELSGGERQRVALGRAIVRQPGLFLFDEPLSNLDAPARLQLRLELARLRRRLNATALYVTHDQVEAMTLGDRIAVMNGGNLQQVDTPTRVYQRPANLFVAGFIGSPAMNFFPGALAESGGALLFRGQPASGAAPSGAPAPRVDEAASPGLRRYAGQSVVLGIRPEHVGLSGVEGAGAEPGGAAIVEAIEPVGPETFLYLRGASGALVARAGAAFVARPGDRLALTFQMRQAHFFDSATGTRLE